MPSPDRPASDRPAPEPIAAPDDGGDARAHGAPAPQVSSTLLEHRPTVLGLARLSHRTTLSPGEETVYRRIAQLVELDGGDEFLMFPSGRGTASLFLARTADAAGSGVDPDAELVAFAAELAREAGLEGRLHYDVAPGFELPYKNGVFDLTIGDVGLAALRQPAAAVKELARVTRPMGNVALIQPVWSQQVEPERRGPLIAHLGVRPFLIMEWKQMLRDAGVVDLKVEDLTDSPGSWQTLLGTGALDLPSVRERSEMFWRAWRTWGWRGLRRSLAAVHELRHLILRERILGLALIRGTPWQDDSKSTR
ncbi:MAG: class I SAM-dependent methyltransferase [Longimicrobiales bacterium]